MIYRVFGLLMMLFLAPATAVTQQKNPPTGQAPIPSLFSSWGAAVGYVFIGLVVVAVGVFLYGAVLKLLQKANLYTDPVQEAINNGILAINTQNTSILSSLTTLNGLYTTLNTEVTASNTQIKADLKTLLGSVANLDQHVQGVQVALAHDTHGLRKISHRQLDMKEAYTEKIKEVQGELARTLEAVCAIKQHIQNEVFKERQTKAFEAIHALEATSREISRAVQAGHDLPMGKKVPDTYCRANESLTTLEKELQRAVSTLKDHRKEVDKEMMSSIQTTVVLLEQLVGRVDRLRDRLQELILTAE